jgi:hypothetical protein
VSGIDEWAEQTLWLVKGPCHAVSPARMASASSRDGWATVCSRPPPPVPPNNVISWIATPERWWNDSPECRAECSRTLGLRGPRQWPTSALISAVPVRSGCDAATWVVRSHLQNQLLDPRIETWPTRGGAASESGASCSSSVINGVDAEEIGEHDRRRLGSQERPPRCF